VATQAQHIAVIRAMHWRVQQTAPDVPRDAAVLAEEDENRYVAALERNGFFGPDSWYMNAEANAAFAARAKANWRLAMPVLFLHGAYDYVCETINSRLAEPMRTNCIPSVLGDLAFEFNAMGTLSGHGFHPPKAR
jgi:pimeloyl-ACP methyl ester carboxylesterase